MMGMGATSPLLWLLGALAMAIIWGGVWWGLSTLVFHWPARERTPSATDRRHLGTPESQPWQQPTFDPAAGGAKPEHAAPRASTRPRPSRHQHTNTESDYR